MMKKLILIGRVAAGKTTLTQALLGEELHYAKTQSIRYLDTVIDTPGEYTELRQTSGALALYAYEADVVGLVLSANEPYSIFSPCLTSMVNREVIGIITGIDKPDARPDMVENWLRLAGCHRIFRVSSYTGEGLDEIVAFLGQEEKETRAPVPETVQRKAAGKSERVEKRPGTLQNGKTARKRREKRTTV